MSRQFVIGILIFVFVLGGVVFALLSSSQGKTKGSQISKLSLEESQEDNQKQKEFKKESTRMKEQPQMQIDKTKTYQAVFTTSKGEFTIRLYADTLPVTVNNFISLARDGFYDGTIFHRIIKGFMIQGGDPKGDGTGGPGYTIPDEFVEGNTNTKGTIAMANRGPNTGGSQFFINLSDNTFLDWDKDPKTSKHPVFGEVVEGMDVVEAIAEVPVKPDPFGAVSTPVSPITIETIKILEE